MPYTEQHNENRRRQAEIRQARRQMRRDRAQTRQRDYDRELRRELRALMLAEQDMGRRFC